MWSFRRDSFRDSRHLSNQVLAEPKHKIRLALHHTSFFSFPSCLCGLSFGETFPTLPVAIVGPSRSLDGFGALENGYETRPQPRLSSYMGSGFVRSTKTSCLLLRWNRTKNPKPRFSQSPYFFCAINSPDVYVFTFGPRSCAISLTPVWETSSLWPVWWCGIQDENISKLCRVFCIASSFHQHQPIWGYTRVNKEKRRQTGTEMKSWKQKPVLIWWYFALIFFPRLSRGQTRYSGFSWSSFGLLLRKITCQLRSRILNESVTRHNGPTRVEQIGKQPWCVPVWLRKDRSQSSWYTTTIIWWPSPCRGNGCTVDHYCCRAFRTLLIVSHWYKGGEDSHSRIRWVYGECMAPKGDMVNSQVITMSKVSVKKMYAYVIMPRKNV